MLKTPSSGGVIFKPVCGSALQMLVLATGAAHREGTALRCETRYEVPGKGGEETL